MSRAARVVAQAKLNLLLRVLAREDSGYHSLETLFLRIDLGDEIEVRAGEGVHGRTLDCGGDAMPGEGLGPVERNLAWRAATVYADATGWPGAFAITVRKHVPVGGGLGGGSADAGAVLRALDALSPHPLGAQLPELAAGIGADVPFLTIDSPMALAWGRGERLFPLPVLAPRPVVLAVPGFGIATKDAFAWLAAARGGYAPRAAVLAAADFDSWSGIALRAWNDFEPVVGVRHPAIARLVEQLRGEGAAPALMTGSGSAVFGVFEDPLAATAAAAKVERTLRGEGGRGRALTTVTAERVSRVEVSEGGVSALSTA